MKKQKTKDLDGQQKLPGLLVRDWQEVFDAMDIGITASNKNGYFEIFNSKMQAITGYTLEQVKACGDFSRLIYPDPLERQEALERLNEIMQKPGYHEIETQIQAKDGTKKILSVSTSLINYKDQVMFLSIYQDVTQRRKDEQTLKQVKGELEIQAWGLQKANVGIKDLYKELETKTREMDKLNQAKSDFVSIVSHELRTPLSITKEALSLVLDRIPGEINKKQSTILNTAKSNIDRLANIINELLDVSKIEAGKAGMKRKLLDIVAIVKQVISGFEEQAKEKNLKLKTDFSASEIEIYADPDKMIQIFTNLVNNAIKFTEKGFIKISAKELEDKIECAVSDTGIGISQDNLPEVFDKFQQFSRVIGPGERGTGLGLSIVKGLVDMHKGDIRVESQLGKGTKFTFTLPRHDAESLFKEDINEGIKLSAKKGSKMSLVFVSLADFKEVKKQIPKEELRLILKEMCGVLKNTVRREGDIVVGGTSEIAVILTDCNKEGALSVENRLREALDKYLTNERLSGEIKLRFGSAVYPDEAKNDTELIEKAKKA